MANPSGQTDTPKDAAQATAIPAISVRPPRTPAPHEGKPVKKVGFIVNDTIDAATEQSHRLGRILTNKGVQVYETHSARPDKAVNWKRDNNLDIIFTFGGDGTILRAAQAAAPLGVPILGVNLGRVGFLTEINPWQFEEKLPMFLEGQYWLERRAMLQAELWRGETLVGSYLALNDVVASRASLSRVVNCQLTVNGARVTTIVADGVIVATPTGSTAYSMAAGGPILHPELRCVVITPVAPYLTVIRSMVLPDDNTIELGIDTDDESFLTVDGQSFVALHDGDRILIKVAPNPCIFARIQDRDYFSSTLVGRLRRTE
jgi:NAD+ kinase